MTKPHITVAIGGYLQEPSGAGVIHERLGSASAGRSCSLDLKLVSVAPLFKSVPSVWYRLRSRPPVADALVWTSAPLPIAIPRSTTLFPIVYDLRWLKTRSVLGRTYRGLDLARALRRARAIFTISQAVATQLDALTGKEVRVLPLGPGQFEGFDVPEPENTRTIVLIGNAPHKRNEHAAELLMRSSLVRSEFNVVGVRVSHQCSQILRRDLPSGRVFTFGTVSREALAEILTKSSVYVSLGVDEGYGLPYVEASYFGCDVIAPDIPITREVLQAGAPTLVSRHPGVCDLVEALESWSVDRIRKLQEKAVKSRWVDASEALFEHIARHL